MSLYEKQFKLFNPKEKSHKKYYFYTIQKSLEPKILCKGYLKLNSDNYPSQISFKIAPITSFGRLGDEYIYNIKNPPKMGPKMGSLSYKEFQLVKKPQGSKSKLVQLFISPDRTQFNIMIKPAQLPWGNNTCLRSIIGKGAKPPDSAFPIDFLGINIKNDLEDGFEDWYELPPIPKGGQGGYLPNS